MVPIDCFDIAAERYADRPAIIDREVTVSYAQLRLMSQRVASVLAALGPDTSPRAVAIYSPNDYRVMAAMLGIMRAGWTIVPLHERNSLETNLDLLLQTSPSCLVYHSSMSADAEHFVRSVPSIQRSVVFDADPTMDPLLESLSDGRTPTPDWIDSSGNLARPVYYWPTSGSTDRPKVVIDTCATFGVTLTLMRAYHAATAKRHVSLVMGPMSHGAGPHCFIMLTLGGTVLVTSTFDAGALIDLIAEHRVTDSWLSPTALYLLLSQPDIHRRDLSSLRSLQLGTAAVSPDRLVEAVSLFGPRLSVTYGQIETGFVSILDAETLAAAASGDHSERLRSSGRTIFALRAAIMADDGRLVASGEEGEIVVRGSTVKSYLDARATDEARRFGWHHTGDLGYLDQSGFLYVTGRIKDVVNMAGFKVPAAQVERVIMELPQVQDCAVVAAPHAIRGEVVTAVVSVRAGHEVTTDQIMIHCRRRLGQGKAPAAVERWPELPKSGAGKIDKNDIRRRASFARGRVR